MDNKILEESLQQVMRYVEAGAGLAAEQMPLVAQEIVMRAIVLSAGFGGLGIVMLAVGAWLAQCATGDSAAPEMYACGAIISFVVGVPVFLSNAYDLTSVLVAPRLLVLKTLRRML